MPIVNNRQIEFEAYIADLKSSISRFIAERGDAIKPSKMWQEGLNLHRYMMHLPADDLRLVRFHSSFLTGHSVHDYFHFHLDMSDEEAVERLGYKYLTERLGNAFCVGEPPFTPERVLGIPYEGKVINHDVMRYQHVVTALATGNILQSIGHDGIPSFLEIGPGYGGLALAIITALKGRVRYFLVDFPEMFIFSGSYLGRHLPEFMFDLSGIENSEQVTLERHDVRPGIYFLPNHSQVLQGRLGSLDVAINMLSFQEMTEEQIRGYLRFVDESNARFLLSDNFDAHIHNDSMNGKTVSQLLEERFDLFPETRLRDEARAAIGATQWYYNELIIGLNKQTSHEEKLRWLSSRPSLRKTWGGKHFKFDFHL